MFEVLSLHLTQPIQILMPPFLDESAASNGGVYHNFSFGIGESFAPGHITWNAVTWSEMARI
jgi:hypothetical protein